MAYPCAKFHCDTSTNNEDPGKGGCQPPPQKKATKHVKKAQSDYG